MFIMGKALQQEQEAVGTLLTKSGSKESPGSSIGLKISRSAPVGSLSPISLNIIKVLQPSQTVLPSGDQVFKCMSLWGDILHSNHKAIQLLHNGQMGCFHPDLQMGVGCIGMLEEEEQEQSMAPLQTPDPSLGCIAGMVLLISLSVRNHALLHRTPS